MFNSAKNKLLRFSITNINVKTIYLDDHQSFINNIEMIVQIYLLLLHVHVNLNRFFKSMRSRSHSHSSLSSISSRYIMSHKRAFIRS